MSLRRHREAVRVAEAAVERRHAVLRAHWETLRGTGRAAVTPGRIVVAGLLLGYLGGKLAPAMRHPEFKTELDRGIDLITQLLRLLAVGVPALAPLWAAKAAGEQAVGGEPP